MPVRDIRATIGVDGEKEFTAALNEAVRSMKLMDGEMKKVSAAYELSGDQTEYLAQKSRLLDSEMRQQERIVDALTGALSDAEKKYEGNTYKIDQYRTKLNAAETTMLKLRKASADTDKELEELGRDSERTGRRLEQGIGEAADDVSRKFDGMVNKLDSDIGSIKSMTSISAVVDVAGTIGGAVKGAYDGVKGLADETAEYNRDIGKLKTNAQNAGIEFALVKDLTKDIAVITGDMDASIEGMSNLLGAGLNADELVDVVNQLLGAIIKFPDTMKFETLAEDLRMAIGEGGISGSLSELLTTLLPNGIKDLELLNKAIVNASKVGEGPKKTAVLSSLTELGLEETYELYKAQNEEITKYYEAQYKLTDAMANLGKTMTPAATAGIEAMSGFIDKLNEMVVSVINTVEKLNVDDPVQNKLIEWADKLSGVDTQEEYTQTGKNMIDSIVDGVENESENSETDLTEIGRGIGSDINDGLNEQIDTVASTAAAMYQAIEAELNKPVTGPSVRMPGYGTATSYGGQGSLNVNVNSYIDGKKLSESTAKSNSDAIGNAIDRAITYGP